MTKPARPFFLTLNQNVKQQVVPFDQISDNIKKATIAIEDEDFYNHKGIEFNSILSEQFLLT
jgi:membrane peptidoglycan carboxypeptidase